MTEDYGVLCVWGGAGVKGAPSMHRNEYRRGEVETVRITIIREIVGAKRVLVLSFSLIFLFLWN